MQDALGRCNQLIQRNVAISNPLVITRVVKAPAAPNSDIGFLVVVTLKYRP